MGLGGAHGVKIPAGLAVVRLESQRLLELPDRLADAPLLVKGGAQVSGIRVRYRGRRRNAI